MGGSRIKTAWHEIITGWVFFWFFFALRLACQYKADSLTVINYRPISVHCRRGQIRLCQRGQKAVLRFTRECCSLDADTYAKAR